MSSNNNNISALPFPHKTPSEVELSNAWLGRRRSLKWGQGKSSWEIEWIEDAGAIEPKYVLELDVEGTAWSLGLVAWPSLTFADVVLDPESIEALPQDVAVLYLEASLSDTLEAFEKTYGTAVRLKRIGHEWQPEITPGALCLHWQWKDASQTLLAEGLMQLQAAQLAALSPHLENLPLRKTHALVESIEWDVRLELGSTVLGAQDFKSLRLSDVIVFDDQEKLQQGGVRVWVDEHILYDAKLQDKNITLKTMSQNPDSLNAKSVLNPECQLEELPVVLSFEVGRRRLTLNEIKALGPGFTFEFEDKPIDRPITIIANGVTVGSGELVQVGDFLGVRVVGWTISGHNDVPVDVAASEINDESDLSQ